MPLITKLFIESGLILVSKLPICFKLVSLRFVWHLASNGKNFAANSSAKVELPVLRSFWFINAFIKVPELAVRHPADHRRPRVFLLQKRGLFHRDGADDRIYGGHAAG